MRDAIVVALGFACWGCAGADRSHSATPSEGGLAGSSGGAHAIAGAGGTSSAQAGMAGQAGAEPECRVATDCDAPAEECLAPVCNAGVCGTEPKTASSACSAGVCSGTGICGACVPGEGRCQEGTPSLCSAEAEWVASEPCGFGQTCADGTCVSGKLDWHELTLGSGLQYFRSAALHRTGELLATGTLDGTAMLGSMGLLNLFGTGGHDPFVASFLRDGSDLQSAFTLDGTGHSADVRVASTGADYAILASINGTPSWETATYEAAVAHVRQYPEGTAPSAGIGQTFVADGGAVHEPIGIATSSTETYVAFMHTGTALRWTGSPAPVPAEPGAPWQTVLAALDRQGNPTWVRSYAWSGRDSSLSLAPAGELYLSGSASQGFAADGQTVDPNAAIIVELDPTSGELVRVRSFECTDTGHVHALGFLSNGDRIAVLTCAGELSIDGRPAPANALLIRMNAELEVISRDRIGSASSATGRLFGIDLAVSPSDVIYLAGSVAGDWDFGAGTHVNQGTCFRCDPGDGFLASFSADLTVRWSQPVGSVGLDRGAAIAADDTRVYAAFNIGGEVTLGDAVLTPDGTTAGAMLAFSE